MSSPTFCDPFHLWLLFLPWSTSELLSSKEGWVFSRVSPQSQCLCGNLLLFFSSLLLISSASLPIDVTQGSRLSCKFGCFDCTSSCKATGARGFFFFFFKVTHSKNRQLIENLFALGCLGHLFLVSVKLGKHWVNKVDQQLSLMSGSLSHRPEWAE